MLHTAATKMVSDNKIKLKIEKQFGV